MAHLHLGLVSSRLAVGTLITWAVLDPAGAAAVFPSGSSGTVAVDLSRTTATSGVFAGTGVVSNGVVGEGGDARGWVRHDVFAAASFADVSVLW